MKEAYKEFLKLLPSKGIIIFGEIHGTKEIPKIFADIVNELAQWKDFTICIEVPEENQHYFNLFLTYDEEKYLKKAPFFKKDLETDGRNSREFFFLIKEIPKINKKWKRNINIICIDPHHWHSQAQREEELAKNILNGSKKELSLALVGNVHAAKQLFFIDNIIIEPMAYKLLKKYKQEVFSIAFVPEKGHYFNHGKKRISGLCNAHFYDSVYKIPLVHTCTFFKNEE